MVDIQFIKFVYTPLFLATLLECQQFDNHRCRCVCPSLAAILNRTLIKDRQLYIANVPPNQCNCYGVILPRMGEDVKGHEQKFCPRCECKYESRNMTVITVVVLIVVSLLALLTVYMFFMMCLGSFIYMKRVKFYRESNTEEARNLLVQDELED